MCVAVSLGFEPMTLFLTHCSFFFKHPDIQQQHFPNMTVDDLDKLRFHGARVIRDISALVRYVNEANDAKFLEKVHEVHQGLISS